MSDCEPITTRLAKQEKRPKHSKRYKPSERDDLGGMIVNMGAHVDIREVFILWIVFVFVHTEMFAEYILKKISGATNEDCTLTMKGTFFASLVMVLAIVICSMTF